MAETSLAVAPGVITAIAHFSVYSTKLERGWSSKVASALKRVYKQKSSVPVTSLKVLFAELHRTCVMSSDDKRFWEGPQPHPADEASNERKSYLRRLSRDWAATTLKRMLAKTYDGEV